MICLRQDIHDQLSKMSKVASSNVTRAKHLPSVAFFAALPLAQCHKMMCSCLHEHPTSICSATKSQNSVVFSVHCCLACAYFVILNSKNKFTTCVKQSYMYRNKKDSAYNVPSCCYVMYLCLGIFTLWGTKYGQNVSFSHL